MAEPEPERGAPPAPVEAQLAEAGVGAFALSTFGTDWILVLKNDADRAEEAWRRSGHAIAPAVPV